MADDSPLLHRVSHMPFSKAERKVVELLLSIAEYDVASLSAAALAERAGTSRSSVDRLCRRLGYSGLKELRRALLGETRRAGTAPAGQRIAPSDGYGEIAYKVFHSASVRALRFAELLARLPELPQLVEALRSSPNVQAFGAGASAVVAHDLSQRLLRLGIRIGFAEDHHDQIAMAAVMRPGDLAIAISFSGRTRLTLNAAEIARDRGATVAAVLGVPSSPLQVIADIPIITPPGISLYGADAVMTRVLEMMFNEVLFHCLVSRDPDLLANAARVEAALATDRA
ncbi:MAG: MurR/RpiR family transcriptional regulator [Amaricoccus sp.]